jgi:hypothetical protein
LFLGGSYKKGMRWAGHVTSLEDIRDIDRILVGRFESKRTFVRPGFK